MKKRNFTILTALALRGWTQGDLSRACENINETRLSRIINRYTIPSNIEIHEISKALNLPPKKLDLIEVKNAKN